MHIIILMILVNIAFVYSEKKYFYIYEWPSELDDVYPPPGAVLDKKASYSHDFYENNGAGKMIDGKYGMFSTWQFSLYKNIMSRLRISEYRTLDPDKASAFIVPYDAGVHSFIDSETGRVRLASPHGWTAGHHLTKASKTGTWKNMGHDHFAFFSVTGYQMVGIGTKVFFMNICQNCTVLTIETTPNNIAIKGRTNKYWYAVPYPSSFHWWEGIKVKPWVVTSDSHDRRTILSIFIGSVKTAASNSNALRRSLYSECLADTIAHGGTGGDGITSGITSNAGSCQWHVAAHACTGVVNKTNTMLLYYESVFCLAPPGDSLTRKSLFDSYMTGCIPVIFAKATLTQYQWFLSPEEIQSTTVFIPKQDIISGEVKYLDILKGMSRSDVLGKQKEIERIAPRLQYSVVPKDQVGIIGTTWKPPQRDATDIIIDRILDRKTVEPMSGLTKEELIQLQKDQRAIMSTDPDYMGMPGTEKKKKKTFPL